MSNAEFWVAISEGIAIVVGVVEELIRNLVLKKRRKKKKKEEDIEVTLTERGATKKEGEEEKRALQISVVRKE